MAKKISSLLSNQPKDYLRGSKAGESSKITVSKTAPLPEQSKQGGDKYIIHPDQAAT